MGRKVGTSRVLLQLDLGCMERLYALATVETSLVSAGEPAACWKQVRCD